MAERSSKSLSGLLSGLAQIGYYHSSGITEQMLKDELYPELPQQDFKIQLEKMGGILRESEFLCLELDETKVNQLLKKLTEIEENIGALSYTN